MRASRLVWLANYSMHEVFGQVHELLEKDRLVSARRISMRRATGWCAGLKPIAAALTGLKRFRTALDAGYRYDRFAGDGRAPQL